MNTDTNENILYFQRFNLNTQLIQLEMEKNVLLKLIHKRMKRRKLSLYLKDIKQNTHQSQFLSENRSRLLVGILHFCYKVYP